MMRQKTRIAELERRLIDLERRLMPVEAWYYAYTWQPGSNTVVGCQALADTEHNNVFSP